MHKSFKLGLDYNQLINCPYGCQAKITEQGLSYHITICQYKNDSYGHCKYNFFHIYQKQELLKHESNCPSNIQMNVDDFATIVPQSSTWGGESDPVSNKMWLNAQDANERLLLKNAGCCQRFWYHLKKKFRALLL
ncbi:hypothetical protein pb186bvf_002371 [Paramecium bursaria]